MRVPRVCLLFFTAALVPALHASTRSNARRLVPAPAPVNRTNALVIHQLSFRHHYAPALDLPAAAVPSAVNAPSPSHGFSLISFAVHSVLGLFGHSPA